MAYGWKRARRRSRTEGCCTIRAAAPCSPRFAFRSHAKLQSATGVHPPASAGRITITLKKPASPQPVPQLFLAIQYLRLKTRQRAVRWGVASTCSNAWAWARVRWCGGDGVVICSCYM